MISPSVELDQEVELLTLLVRAEKMEKAHLERHDELVEVVDGGAHAALEQGGELAAARLGDAQERVVGDVAACHGLDQALQAQELDRGAENVEGRTHDAAREVTHRRRELAVALWALAEHAECCKPDRLGGDERLVAIHEWKPPRAPEDIVPRGGDVHK